MSYKLEYPYTEDEKLNFIVEYNHQQGLRIETVDNFVEVETTEEITEEREIVDEETGEVIGTETVVVDTKTYTETQNYPTYYALEKNEIMVNDVPVIDPEYEEKEAQKERERIAMLSLTRGDVFRALYLAKGVTRAQIRALIENNELISEAKRELSLIDFDEALNFYRGNVLIDTLGLALGITSKQLDEFFETNNYTCLFDDPQENQDTSEVEPTDDPSLAQEESFNLDENS